ncbi:MAG TPA: voltage-gated chloride channel family protein [Tepidisphaeraceae bacterium]|jgi:H+/Cl- antiporter ClcA|nr:voltage-gated chloride channel family protein [Tepidisphaeraceae bacterium]
MPFRWNPREHAALASHVLKWLLIAIPLGIVVGSAVALFLWALDRATQIRWSTDMGNGIPWLLFLLPVGGIGIGLVYQLFGKSVEGGNNLIMEQIHEPGGGVPSRMAPLVLIGTVVTHLFGGSAGREGTAVQMGGSIASTIGRWLKLSPIDTRTLLMAGVAAGFGAVFGTPLTGAIFAVEVLAIGLVSFQSMIPCLIASVVGDNVTAAWGIHHTHYYIGTVIRMGLVHDIPGLNLALLGKVALASVAFGLASVVFAELAHSLHRIYKWIMPWPAFRPALGGVLVIALAFLVGPDFLGLGVVADPHHVNQVTIVSAFHAGGATYWSWWWKILFTGVTLSSGFKGGEVTPLFFVGAALGNTMGRLLGAPVDLFAGLGLVGVFAGATNTPLACTIMGIELFATGQSDMVHSGFIVYVAVACFLSYLLSGHSGIYLSQRIGSPKIFSPDLPPDSSLRTVREMQPGLGAGLFSNLGGGLRNPIDPSGNDRNGDGAEHDREISESHSVELDTPTYKSEPSTTGGNDMPHRHKVSAREIGQVRIYMTPGEKRKGMGFKGMFSKPLYQEIIDAAKVDGILNAAAHHTHYGYSGNGKVQSNNQELPNQMLNLCVELIAHRDQLELFCRKHGDLLEGRVIVYKHMEHWDISHHDTIRAVEVPQEELDVDVEDDVDDAEQ